MRFSLSKRFIGFVFKRIVPLSVVVVVIAVELCGKGVCPFQRIACLGLLVGYANGINFPSTATTPCCIQGVVA